MEKTKVRYNVYVEDIFEDQTIFEVEATSKEHAERIAKMKWQANWFTKNTPMFVTMVSEVI